MNESNQVEELFYRWISTLRYKASIYEHEARKRGEEVASLSLDDVCNEMKAYLTGVNTMPNDPMKLETEFREKFCWKGDSGTWYPNGGSYTEILARNEAIFAWFKAKLDEKDLQIDLRNDLIDRIKRRRVMEQGGWQQVEAYQEEIATIKAQLSRFEKGEAAPIIMVKQKEEIIKLRVEIERLKGQEEK